MAETRCNLFESAQTEKTAVERALLLLLATGKKDKYDQPFHLLTEVDSA